MAAKPHVRRPRPGSRVSRGRVELAPRDLPTGGKQVLDVGVAGVVHDVSHENDLGLDADRAMAGVDRDAVVVDVVDWAGVGFEVDSGRQVERWLRGWEGAGIVI